MGVALFHPEHPIFGGTARGENLSTDKYAQMKIRRGSDRNRFSCHRLQVKSSWKSPLSQRRAPSLVQGKEDPSDSNVHTGQLENFMTGIS